MIMGTLARDLCQYQCADTFQVSSIRLTDQIFQARFMGKEYVVTQPIDSHMDNTSAQSVLKVEYGLLRVGDTLKREFDRYAQECDKVTIPGMYFFPLLIDLCKRPLQARQGRVLSFAMEIVFMVIYL